MADSFGRGTHRTTLGWAKWSARNGIGISWRTACGRDTAFQPAAPANGQRRFEDVVRGLRARRHLSRDWMAFGSFWRLDFKPQRIFTRIAQLARWNSLHHSLVPRRNPFCFPPVARSPLRSAGNDAGWGAD